MSIRLCTSLNLGTVMVLTLVGHVELQQSVKSGSVIQASSEPELRLSKLRLGKLRLSKLILRQAHTQASSGSASSDSGKLRLRQAWAQQALTRQEEQSQTKQQHETMPCNPRLTLW